MNTSNDYGKELILDLHNCNAKKFNRKDLEIFFRELCDLIDMQRQDLHWWDDYGVAIEEQQTEPHLKGTSAVQFIMTSNITIHTLDILKNVYINIFSCKSFEDSVAVDFCQKFFEGVIVNKIIINRK